ncbi:MAG: hypothetical protein H0W02_07690 [Ktedonobacteraceae bacterium]|nr:hypothetical protein [Ktedonobacteraceae bacterium]
MAREMDIFVNTEESLEEFTNVLESLVGISAQRCSTNDEIWYELQDERTSLSVGTHEYINNQGMNFEAYRYDIEVREINIREAEERVQWLHDTAFMIFNRLKDTRRYPLLLADDLQKKVEEYQP